MALERIDELERRVAAGGPLGNPSSIDVVTPEDVLGIGVGTDILIVDDDQGNLVAYEAALAPLGRKVVAAGSGIEALARLLEQDFALMLLDVQMPQMDGLETARLARARPRNLGMPIVFITGAASWSDVIVEAYEAGAYDFVVKPIMPEVLRAKVRVHLQLQERTQQLLANARRLAQAEEQVRKGNVIAAAAESASSRKDQYLAMLGHELRNPLAAMVSAIELLKFRDGGLGRELTILNRHLVHLTQLVNDLVDVSRLTRGKITLRPVAVEVTSAIEDAIELARPVLAEHGHELDLKVAVGLFVEADRQRIVQVIANLVTNAAKYTPGKGRIEILAERIGDTVRIAVTDHGIGIDPALLPHLFDVFVQGEQALDRQAGGLGVGLTIVRTLVELHGGRVEAHSAGPDRGSTFTLHWPAISSSTPTAESLPLVMSGDVKPLRALVVDDNDDVADLLAALLAELGHEVAIARDRRSAYATATHLVPDVVFVDLRMAELDVIAAELGGLAGKPVLVALTNYEQPDDRERAERAGFRHQFVKPLDFKTLTALLAALRTR